MYFETEYFGGAGTQGFVFLEKGKVVLGPKWGERNVINEGLRMLGVDSRSLIVDEFDFVGLNRLRSTEKWMAFIVEKTG